MENIPSSHCAALKHWPVCRQGKAAPLCQNQGRTKWASLSSSKHFRKLQSARVPLLSRVSRNHKYFFKGIRRGHKDKPSCILVYIYVYRNKGHTCKATAKEEYCRLSWAAYIKQAFTAARKHRLIDAPEQEWTVFRGWAKILKWSLSLLSLIL